MRWIHNQILNNSSHKNNSIRIANLTLVWLSDVNFGLQGIYCCIGGDELLFDDDDACVVSHGENMLASDEDHDWPKYLLHCWLNLICSTADIIASLK